MVTAWRCRGRGAIQKRTDVQGAGVWLQVRVETPAGHWGAWPAPVRTLALQLGRDARETWESFEQGMTKPNSHEARGCWRRRLPEASRPVAPALTQAATNPGRLLFLPVPPHPLGLSPRVF